MPSNLAIICFPFQTLLILNRPATFVSMSETKYLIAVCGPTAVGKTAMAIKLAQHLGSEIISFDSRQFYGELKIGSAMPSAQELTQARHHFIGHLSVKEHWSAGQFADKALEKIKRLFEYQNPIITVGGSGLYLQALAEGLDELPPVPPEIRAKWQARYEKEGLQALQDAVAAKDPEYYATVDRQNPRRLLRSLEIAEAGGKPYSQLRQRKGALRPFRTLYLGLHMERAALYERINERAEAMLRLGLAEEAYALREYEQLPALQTVGYREFFAHFKGTWSEADTLIEIQKNTRRYAKRQLTWFRRNPQLSWFHPDRWTDILNHLQQQMEYQRL